MTWNNTGQGPVQIGGNGSDVLRDGHLIVVKNNQEIFPQRSGMLQTFQRHPGSHGAVADDADDLVALLQLLTRLDHAVSRGYAGSGMACVERVVFAFLALTKAAQPSILPERVEPLATPC